METDNSEIKSIRNINTKIFVHNNGVDCAPTQVRRMLIPYGQTSLDKFVADINQSFKEHVTLDTYVMRYQDEEKDWVDFHTELEWVAALHMAHINQIPLLKLQLIKKSIDSRRRDVTTNNRFSPYTTVRREINHANAHQVIPELLGMMHRFMPNMNVSSGEVIPLDSENGPHYGTICDGCNIKDWVGKRYKCVECANFDLCEDCYNNSNVRDEHFGGHHTFDLRILPKIPDTTDDNANLQLLSQSFDKTLSTLNSSNSTVDSVETTVSSTPEANVFEKELIVLQDMGFVNREENLRFLRKHSGDLQKVIVDLLNQKKTVENDFYFI